jgi:hypothetical protein
MNESKAMSTQLSMVSFATLIPPFFHWSLTIARASGESGLWLNRQLLPCSHFPRPNKNLQGCNLPSCEYLKNAEELTLNYQQQLTTAQEGCSHAIVSIFALSGKMKNAPERDY